MRTSIISTAAALAITACAGNQPKMLIICYSQTGVTETVANEIQSQTGADIEFIDVEQPYDGDHSATVSRCREEMDNGTLSHLKPLHHNPEAYDVIFLGYPVWFGTYARPIMSFLDETDLKGKTIVPFCTFGSGGLESSTVRLKAAVPGADIRDGFGIRAARISKAGKEVADFLIRAGFKEGTVEELPDFSQQQPVDDNLSAIFKAACGNYPMPLGTPVSAGSRLTSEGTEYLFTAEGLTPDGEALRLQIYVTVANDGNIEFTRVVR